MIAVGAYHAFGFFIEHSLHRRAGTDLVPHSGLGLQIESDLIGGFERCLRRAPRMEAHVVQTPLLTQIEQVLPRFDVSGWITGEWKIATEDCAAKINGIAVEDKLISLSMKIAQADSHVLVLIDVRTFQPESQG